MNEKKEVKWNDEKKGAKHKRQQLRKNVKIFP